MALRDRLCLAHFLHYGEALVLLEGAREVIDFMTGHFEQAFTRLSQATGAPSVFALWGSRVAFFVLAQEADADELGRAGRELARRWQPMLAFTAASEFEQAIS